MCLILAKNFKVNDIIHDALSIPYMLLEFLEIEMGILYSWIKRTFANNSNYNQMNSLAASVPIGSEGLCILPFGNGAERMLQNIEIGSSIHGINFNTHGKAHLVRAVQEGIVFSFAYGMEIMQKMGMELNTIHAGHSNMFLSSVFRDALAGVSGSVVVVP